MEQIDISVVVVILVVSTWAIYMVRRGIVRNSGGDQGVNLNIAVSPVLPSIKKKSKVANPICEVVTLTRKQLNKVIFVIVGISLIVGAASAVVILDISGKI